MRMRSWPLGISELIQMFTASRTTTNQMKRGPSARRPGGFCGGMPRPSGAGCTRQPFGCSWSPLRSGNGVVGLEGRSFWASRSFRLRGSSAIPTQRTGVALPRRTKFGRLLTRCLPADHPERRTLRGTGFAPDRRRSKMDRTLATLHAQFDTLDAHVEGIGNTADAGRAAGMPALEKVFSRAKVVGRAAGMPVLDLCARETSARWPEPPPVPLLHDEEDMD